MRRVSILVLAAIAACAGPIDRKRVNADIEQLASISAEARLILDETSPPHYAAEQLAELARKVDDIRDELARGTDDAALEHLLAAARVRADELTGELAARRARP